MAQDSYPSVAHTAITLAEGEDLLSALALSGLIGEPNQTAAIYGDSTGMHVKLRMGKSALMRGNNFWRSHTADETIAISANAGATRYDLIVLRLDRADWSVSVEVVEGTSGNPVPTVTQTAGSAGVWEVALAVVTVISGAVTITAAQVQPVEVYIGAPSVVVRNSAGLAHVTHRRAQLVSDEATKRLYYDDGTVFRVLAEDTGLIAIDSAAVAPGWTIPPGQGGNVVMYGRHNGVAYLQIRANRTGSNLPANPNVMFAQLPGGFYPSSTHDFVVHQANTHDSALISVNASGVMVLHTSGPIAGSGVEILYGSTCYPAA